jgi:imidazolonepropionase-like amidohydrolase
MIRPTLGRAVSGALALVASAAVVFAQAGQPTSNSPLAPPPNGVRKTEPAGGWHALVGATVHVSPTKTIDKATVVVREGRIVSVDERGGAAPAGAQAHNAAGLHIYAGFIEPYLEVEAPRPDPDAPGSHWNPRVTPQRSALDKGSRGVDDKTGQALREMGFVAAAISPQGGIFRGTSAVVSLGRPSGDISQTAPRVYRDGAYQAMSFETAGGGGRDERPDDVRWSRYPGSEMGAIALIRQTLSDADWQQKRRRETIYNEPQNALDALAAPQVEAVPEGVGHQSVLHGWGGLLFIDAADELDALRAAKIGKEFHRDVAVLGSGREYARLQSIVADAVPLVLPLSFPRAPDVSTLGAANAAELDDLMRWEQAPTNPRRVDAALRAAGEKRAMDVSLTTSKAREGGRGRRGGGTQRGEIGSVVGGESTGGGTEQRSAFWGNLSKAIKHGLPPERALAMLTVNPAKLLGVESVLGTVETGKAASFVVADGPLFTDKPDAPKKGEPGYVRPAKVVSVWIDGEETIVNERPEIDITGRYEVTITPPLPAEMKIRFNFAADDPAEEPEFTVTKATRDATGHEETVDIKVKDFDRSGPGQSRFTFSFEHEPFGEKGVFMNSGVIEKDADGTVVLHGDFVRTSGVRMTWTARRTGAAAPKKPSLAGAWPITFEKEGGGSPVLMFDKGNVLTVQSAPGGRGREDGKPSKVDNFSYDGKSIKYDFDQSQFGLPGIEGVVKVEANVDWSVRPARMSGVLTPPAGEKIRWTATRRESNPFAGEWRVTQADGQAMPEDGPEGLIIKIGGGRDKATLKLVFTRTGKPPFEITGDEVAIRNGKLFFSHSLEKLGGDGKSSDEVGVTWGKAGPEGDTLVGLGRMPDGSVHPYEAIRTKASLSGDAKEAAAIAAIPEKLNVPFGPYGVEALPAQERVVITGATIWTCKDGSTDTVIEDGAVVISEGKIQYAGPSASLPRLAGEFVTIDAKGKFVAPGIIDCHSHTGITRGVNEGGQAVTAEVRIGDVTDPDNVSWYRQLAGGVTCVNNLHGSANAIGGQNQVNKIRWGCARPDGMHLEGAIPGIKFALGENPKQSNWGDRSTTRYPQTRMGVETLIRDRFTAAREYAAAMKSANPPRRDLELEALAEILDGKRLIHCHSYRQDEILMLCRVAQDFGFKIGTFQHILEGYKVADELARWSGGGSGFSDWWAYKFEVVDAIPADGPLMAEQGVIVSYNSDSDEMARRLNVEAGKATKYSGKHGGKAIPPHEAYKFVTLNPAKQLRIDARTGSLESGKDADLCIWSGPPTSATSRCEATWVDGRREFSLEQDAANRKRITGERQRLVQKVLAEGAGPRRGRGGGGDGGDEPESDSEISNLKSEVAEARAAGRRFILLDAVDQAADARREIYMNMLLRGLDPRWMGAGECGCGVMNGGGE